MLLIVLFVLFTDLYITLSSGNTISITVEESDNYKLTMYFNRGEYTGVYKYKTEETSDTYTNDFGSYSNVIKTKYTSVVLSTENSNKITITNQYSLTDTKGNLVYSQNTYSIDIYGYEKDKFTTKTEYGNYSVLLDEDDIYSEEYYSREFTDEILESENRYEDIYTIVTDSDAIKIPSGIYKCTVLEIDSYINEVFTGKTQVWLENSKIIQQYQYDEEDKLVTKLQITTESLTKPTFTFDFSFGISIDWNFVVMTILIGTTLFAIYQYFKVSKID